MKLYWTYSSGYGGSGKFSDSHSYAASVTCAMCGPRYSKNVCRPVPKPTDDKIPVCNVRKLFKSSCTMR